MRPAPVLLQTMGVRFARTLLSDLYLKSEQKLWRAVVVNAVEDCMIQQSDRKSSLIKINAHNWILSNNKNFHLVCHWGSLDPDVVEESYKRALSSKKLYFTKRQVAWFEYDKIYKKLLNCSSNYYKKQLRRKLDTMRVHVKSTPATNVSTIFLSAFV